MDIEERLKAEQHEKLKELQGKIDEVPEHEPAGCEDADELEIWKWANSLKYMLDDFFDGRP